MATLVIHYSEIALKGRNRPAFERRLMENIRGVLRNVEAVGDVRRMGGRLRVTVPEASDDALERLSERLARTPGIAWFADATQAPLDLATIGASAWDQLRERPFTTLAIRTRRSNKQFPATAHDTDVAVGSLVVERLEESRGEHPQKFTDASGKTHYGWVDLEKPDVTVFIEITEDRAFLFTDHERTEGVGGLPVSSAGTVVVLLSSGIDSPVAAFRMIKRGCRAVFVHLHSYPYTSRESQDAVRDIVRVLARSQGPSMLALVSFTDAQRAMADRTEPRLLLLLYRRFFLRAAEAVAKQHNALGIVTGESVGQVASQTLHNMQSVESVVGLPVYRPLIGFNKEEAVWEAQRLGTFAISARSGDDCCSLFLPPHPETRATVAELDAAEKGLPVEDWLTEALEKTHYETIL